MLANLTNELLNCNESKLQKERGIDRQKINFKARDQDTNDRSRIEANADNDIYRGHAKTNTDKNKD